MDDLKGGNATSRPALTPPLKWHPDGGKHYLARRIVALMPPHLHYVEPYAGGLAVLLARDPEGVSEVANDLNGQLSNFWAALQNCEAFELIRRRAEAVPFSEDEWRRAAAHLERPCAVTPGTVCSGCALAFFVCCRMSLAGRMKSFSGVTRTRTRRGMNNEVSAWLSCVEGLPAVHARLRRVLILSRPAQDVIGGQDGPDTLFYLDPPYLHETRATTADYAFEMSGADHFDLLGALASVRGKFILSGYRSAMYDAEAARHGWRRVDVEVANHAAGGDAKRRMTECLWLNYDPAVAQ
jgi:DNA adenine methylase